MLIRRLIRSVRVSLAAGTTYAAVRASTTTALTTTRTTRAVAMVARPVMGPMRFPFYGCRGFYTSRNLRLTRTVPGRPGRRGRHNGEVTPPPSARGGRRAELLEAAVDVVAESGLRGLTHRAVDARAGLPEGTCSAYLRTRLALLIGLTEHVGGLLARDVDAMAAKAAPHAEDSDAISTAVTDLLLHWLHRPELVRTQAE